MDQEDLNLQQTTAWIWLLLKLDPTKGGELLLLAKSVRSSRHDVWLPHSLLLLWSNISLRSSIPLPERSVTMTTALHNSMRCSSKMPTNQLKIFVMKLLVYMTRSTACEWVIKAKQTSWERRSLSSGSKINLSRANWNWFRWSLICHPQTLIVLVSHLLPTLPPANIPLTWPMNWTQTSKVTFLLIMLRKKDVYFFLLVQYTKENPSSCHSILSFSYTQHIDLWTSSIVNSVSIKHQINEIKHKL